MADVQYNRAVGIVGRLRARAVGRAKFVNAGSLRVGDALEQYGESRRPAIVQLSARPKLMGGRGTGVQPLRGSRRAHNWRGIVPYLEGSVREEARIMFVA